MKVRNSWGLQSLGGPPCFSRLYSQSSHQDLLMRIQEKVPHVSSRGKNSPRGTLTITKAHSPGQDGGTLKCLILGLGHLVHQEIRKHLKKNTHDMGLSKCSRSHLSEFPIARAGKILATK